MKKQKKILLVGFLALAFNNIAFAEDDVPARPDVCAKVQEGKQKVKEYLTAKQGDCVDKYGIRTDNRAEESDLWSQNPDANCDLGLEFPSLPGFDFNMDGLNTCELVQGVTSDVVDDVNGATQDAVDNATKNVTGDEDGLDIDVDLQDEVEDAIESDN